MIVHKYSEKDISPKKQKNKQKQKRAQTVVSQLLRVTVGTHTCMYIWMYGVIVYYSKSKYQPDKVANPARGQLNRENEYFSVPVRA